MVVSKPSNVQLKPACLLLSLALLLAGHGSALAQDKRTTTMVFHGLVRDVKGRPVNGVTVSITDLTTKRSGSSSTPHLAGVAGSYFLWISDANNNTAARSNDNIQITISDPSNRLGRAPKWMPGSFSLGKADVLACVKRLDLTMY